jgi:serine/threonine-protein kinase
MNDTYTRLRARFEACVDLPDGERERWIDEHVSDTGERIELELMLAADHGESGFLRRDAVAHIDEFHGVAEKEFRPENLIGRQFGAFRLQRLIGRGGQGTVYLAERVGSDFSQTAAVKLLSRGIHGSAEYRRFRREREILARFEHAGVARLIDGGVSGDGVPFLVMEYVEGATITQWCNERNLDMRARIALFAQLCDVVAAAHRALIVHRDLKPSNVLVTPEGAVKVLDFGIARLLDEDEERTQTAVPIMTPGYGAPEQAQGGAITLATDVHALGVLLRELLTGTPPAGNADLMPPIPASVAPELRWVIGRACAIEAQQRYRDAAELGDDIARHLGARPVLAHPPSRWYTTRKFVRRHRGGVLTSVAVVLGVLASASVALWQANVAREQAQRAEAARDFLLSIFEAAQEDLPKDARPTPDVLARAAAKKLEGDSRLAPTMRSEFLGTLGKISYSSSDYTQAVEYADRAIATLDAGGDTDSRQHLGLEVARAEALNHLNRYADADRALEPRMDLIRARDDAVAVDGVGVYAKARRRTGHLDDALSLAREAAERARRVYAADSPAVEDAELSYGFELLNSGRTREAIDVFEARRAAWQTHHATPDRNYVALLENLAHLKMKVGDTDAAERLMRECVQLTRRIFEAPHEEIASALHNFGVLLAGIGRYEEAEPMLREAAGMYEAVFGAQHSQTITAIGMQGAVENKRGHYSAALPPLLRATTACTEAKLDSEPACAYNWQYLSLAYLKLGRLSEAEAANERSIELRMKLFGDKNPDYAKALLAKADILVARGQPAAALAVLDTASAIFTEKGQADGLSGANTLVSRARALAALDRSADALDCVTRSEAMIQRLAPKDEGRRLELLVLRADILSRMDRRDEARDAARAALKFESQRATIDAALWQRIELLAR